MKQYFGDPDEAYWRYDADQAKEDPRAPRCLLCGERIYDDFCYVITKSDYGEEQWNSSVHRTCLKMRRGMKRDERYNDAVCDLIEDECYQRTPRKEGDYESL